jgi:hypothetical protein
VSSKNLPLVPRSAYEENTNLDLSAFKNLVENTGTVSYSIPERQEATVQPNYANSVEHINFLGALLARGLESNGG